MSTLEEVRSKWEGTVIGEIELDDDGYPILYVIHESFDQVRVNRYFPAVHVVDGQVVFDNWQVSVDKTYSDPVQAWAFIDGLMSENRQRKTWTIKEDTR